MSVDVTNLVDLLITEVNIPGGDAFPGATVSQWENYLLNAFWETVLDGIITGYTMDEDGLVTPTSGSTELSRELQQLVIFYAGVTIVRNALRTLNSVFRAKAGPVEFETQNAATVMKGILDELVRRRNLILIRLGDVGASNTTYIDAVLARNESFGLGITPWVGHMYGGSFGTSSDEFY